MMIGEYDFESNFLWDQVEVRVRHLVLHIVHIYLFYILIIYCNFLEFL